MKKSSFLEGAFIATLGIILCKMIGLLYVIPFYSIIGTQGGALYSYAYSIYAVFLSLSTSGIPIAISKLVSEYQTMEYYNSKERVYKIGLALIMTLSVVLFVLMMLFAPILAKIILGDLTGGNSVESVTMVIRVISISLLIVPVLSVTKGYLQGHKMMDSPSKANVLEQLIRVGVILFGSLLAVKVFHLSIDTAVGIAVFGATAGAISAYLYLGLKIHNHRQTLNRDAKRTRNEAKITSQVIIKKILFYAFPFLLVDLLKSAFSLVDTFTVVNTLTKIGYEASVTESVIGVLTTWGTKLNMIVVSFSLGISISLVPNIASSYVQKDIAGVNTKVAEAIQTLLFFCLPMAFGLSFLSQAVWTIFYGEQILCASIFSLFIFQAIPFSILTILLNITQTLNDTKTAIGTLLFGFILKAILNIPAMHLCEWLKIGAYYGPSIATICTQGIAIAILLYQLKRKHQISLEKSRNTILKIVLSTLILFMSLKIVGEFIPVAESNRMLAVVKVIFYTILGAIIYFVTVVRSGVFKNIFHNLRKNPFSIRR